MWRPPRGLAWDGQSWSRVVEAPEPEQEADTPAAPARGRAKSPRSGGGRAPASKAGNGHTNGHGNGVAGPPDYRSLAAAPPASPAPPRPPGRAQITAPVRPVPPPVTAPRAVSQRIKRSPKHTLFLVGSAMILILVGVATDIIATNLDRGTPLAAAQTRIAPADLAKKLVGKGFTRDVLPPELAAAPPLRDIFVPGEVPGLVGEATTTTSDQGSTVTIYVFADPVWAQAFFAAPPVPFGCGLCKSMGGATAVPGAGDAATSYVLYRTTTAGGQSWIGTTTYALHGSVVVAGVYFPVNIASPAPTSTDLYEATAYAKAAIGLVGRAGG